jgi:hypothetical protein
MIDHPVLQLRMIRRLFVSGCLAFLHGIVLLKFRTERGAGANCNTAGSLTKTNDTSSAKTWGHDPQIRQLQNCPCRVGPKIRVHERCQGGDDSISVFMRENFEGPRQSVQKATAESNANLISLLVQNKRLAAAAVGLHLLGIILGMFVASLFVGSGDANVSVADNSTGISTNSSPDASVAADIDHDADPSAVGSSSTKNPAGTSEVLFFQSTISRTLSRNSFLKNPPKVWPSPPALRGASLRNPLHLSW